MTTRRVCAILSGLVLLAIGIGFPLTARATASPSGVPGPMSGAGWLRFGQLTSSAGPLGVSVDGTPLSTDVPFETVTPYQQEPAGPHVVTVSPVSGTGPSATTTVDVTVGGAATVVALPASGGLRLTWFDDDLSPAPPGKAKVRIINTGSPTAALVARLTAAPAATPAAGPAQPSTMSASQLVLPSAGYGTASPYEAVAAGSYGVQVVTGGGTPVVTGNRWPVAAGTVASVIEVKTPQGSTLEVVSDAVGTATAPQGGMATGFGGEASALASRAAPGSVPSERDILEGVALIAALLALGVALTDHRRPARHRRHSRHRRSTRRRRRLLAAPLLAVAVGGLALSTVAGPARSAAAPKARGADPAAVVGRPVPGPSTAEPEVDLASSPAPAAIGAPTRIQVPSLGVDAPVEGLGQNPDGSAQVPATTTEVGWYDGGPVPGQAGPAVLLGHVDSTTGPGVFFRLDELTPGADIEVTSGDQVITFAVQAVASYTKTGFPTAAVFGPTPDRALRLVTCGGAFDAETGHYEDNVVVYATEMSAT